MANKPPLTVTVRDQHELPTPREAGAEKTKLQMSVTRAFSDAHRVLDELERQQRISGR